MDLSNSVKIVTAVVFMSISLGLIVVAVRSALRENAKIQTRLSAGVGADGELISPSKPNSNVLETIGDHLTLPGVDEIKRLRHQLAEAGYYSANSVKVFFTCRVLLLLVPQFLIMAFWGMLVDASSVKMVLSLSGFMAAMSILAPGYFLRFKKNKRILQARNGFPDMMDLMVASVEAGLGLDAALMRVTEEVGGRYPVLKTNLDLMNMELRAGAERQTAMATFAERLNLEEAKALAVIVRQAEEMGSSLGVALRTFSADMRMRRMMKAEEKAMALSAKLTVPLIVFIFPAIMVMLLLPSGVRIASGM